MKWRTITSMKEDKKAKQRLKIESHSPSGRFFYSLSVIAVVVVFGCCRWCTCCSCVSKNTLHIMVILCSSRRQKTSWYVKSYREGAKGGSSKINEPHIVVKYERRKMGESDK